MQVHKVLMPRVDAGMREGTILDWLKKEGDSVRKGDPLAKVEGEKVVFDVEAPVSGVLKELLVTEGTTISVGQPIAIIAEEGEEAPKEMEVSVEAPPEKRIRASPAARRIAREHGLDLTKIKGNGPEGMIVEKDVLHAISAEKPEVPPSFEIVEVIPLTGMRKTIADRMVYSYRTAPHVAITMEVDMTEALKLHQTIEKIRGVDIPLTPLLTTVTALALKHHPIMNSVLERDQIKIIKNINIGVAVALEDGLIVPVVHDADKKDLIEIASLVRELIEKARKRELSIEELRGGTFTITNLGGFGVDIFTPIINPPQTAILGVGKIMERAKVVDKQIRAAPIITLTLVFDHRVVDGAKAAQFLKEIKELLEDPYKLFANLCEEDGFS
jgi:pyruvate dehydrogenase E2 component (dihydrolipoamide acetyltransferase)